MVERKSRMELVVGLEQIGKSKTESVELVGTSTGSAVAEHIHTVSFHGLHFQIPLGHMQGRQRQVK